MILEEHSRNHTSFCVLTYTLCLFLLFTLFPVRILSAKMQISLSQWHWLMIVICFIGYAWRCCPWWLTGLVSLLKLLGSFLLCILAKMCCWLHFSKQGCTILSGDVIIRHLAAHFEPEYVVFLVLNLPSNYFSCIWCFKQRYFFPDESRLLLYKKTKNDHNFDL